MCVAPLETRVEKTVNVSSTRPAGLGSQQDRRGHRSSSAPVSAVAWRQVEAAEAADDPAPPGLSRSTGEAARSWPRPRLPPPPRGCQRRGPPTVRRAAGCAACSLQPGWLHGWNGERWWSPSGASSIPIRGFACLRARSPPPRLTKFGASFPDLQPPFYLPQPLRGPLSQPYLLMPLHLSPPPPNPTGHQACVSPYRCFPTFFVPHSFRSSFPTLRVPHFNGVF